MGFSPSIPKVSHFDKCDTSCLIFISQKGLKTGVRHFAVS